MKLTKKVEAEILKAYYDLWDAYLRGDMRTFASILDENCYIIGSAAGEVFSNKKAAVKYYKSTAEQITGKAEFRNRKIKVMPVEKGFMVNEESDFYLRIDDQWTFYGPGRISSLFHKKNNKWKVIHQHGSFPDAKTEEGEQVNTDKIKAENIQLRDAVIRRTEELENKNRELEIESALERVRAKTMAMQKPSEFVDVINVVGDQFVHLGFDIDWVNFGANGFAISEGIDIWNFAVIPGASPMSARVFIPYFDHPVFTTSAATINEFLNGGRDFITVVLDKQTKDTWLDHLFTKTVFKDVPEEYRAIQYAKSGYTTSNISLNNTWLSIGKFDTKTFTDEQHTILRRFANAFGQAYTRFLDLQKAEAQAREAQIEAGLERVRSRAMAMQSSEQLKELIGTVFTELTKLDIVLTRCLIMIYDLKSNDSVWWMANSEAPTQPIGLKVQYHERPSYLAYVNAWKQKELKWTYTLEGNTKKEWDDFLFVETELSHLPDFVIAGMKAPDRVYLNASFNSFGNLTLATLEPLSDEHFDIMLRFAKVFDLTYTRFNDLKQAEAQAREARIETALERIRARTMAMQRSDELPETTFLLFQQLKELGETAAQLSIGIIKEEEGYVELSATVHGNKMLQTYHVPADEPFVMNKVVKAWQEKERSLTVQIEGQELTDYNNWRNSVLETKINFPEDKWIVNIVFFSKGMLSFSSDRQIPKKTRQLLERFAGVFDLTYTRFLDLKQAEAQARESQIQLALERVRARTMAMQKSDELSETSHILFQQFNDLGEAGDQTSIGIFEEDEKVMKLYSTFHGSQWNRPARIEFNKHRVYQNIFSAWKNQKKSFVTELTGKELQDLNKFKLDNPDYQVSENELAKDRWVVYTAFFSNGLLSYASHEPRPKESIQLLERFASVFDLTYTRFLDLQKAEAQTREAQIELALERVRARTMAMHQSEELAETAQVMFHQLQELGGIPDRISIAIPDEANGVVNFWSTDQQGSHLDHSFSARLNERTTIAKTYQAWKEQKKSLVIDLHGEELNEWILFAREEMGIAVKDDQIKDRRVHTLAFFSHGWILVTSHEPQSTETIQILERFASVFNLTYRRFLDLEKAEAQTREAQIEAALEKVRGSAMAMHNSNDISATTTIVFTELRKLGIQSIRCGVGLLSKDSHMAQVYAATTSAHDEFHTLRRNTDMTEHSALAQQYETWLKQENYVAILSGEELRSYYNLPFFHSSASYVPPEHYDQKEYGYYIPFTEGLFYAWTGKPYSEDEQNILSRFKAIIALTFRRYLDLQKAEAQAREAQIEMALEKIRSRSLAMHKSDELQDVVNTVFERLKDLDIEVDSSNIAIFKEGSRDFDYWIASNTQKRTSSFHMPYIDLSLTKDIIAARESGADFSATSYPFEVKNEWFDFAFKETDFKFLSEERKQFILNSPGITVGIAFSKHTGVQVNRYSDKLLSEDEKEILKRFSKVFEQAYIRFLDLEKAEAQARDAQIEASLERVRSKTMAMHNSQDVGYTVATMFDELVKLGVETVRCGIGIMNEPNQMEVWTARKSENEKVELIIGRLDMTVHPLLQGMYNGWKNKDTTFSYELKGDDLVDYFTKLINSPEYHIKYDIGSLPQHQFHYDFYFPEGALFAFSARPLSAESSQIFKRFAGVFGQTYRRYLDLLKAEAQAKEAKIEASLERVRSKTMAMHNSEDVGDTVATMLDELVKLGVETVRCGIAIIDESKSMEVWTASSKEDGSVKLIIGKLDMRIHPLFMHVYDAWENKALVTAYELIGEDLKDYFRAVNNSPDYPIRYDIDSLPYSQSCTSFMFPEGLLFVFSQEPLVIETIQIFKRFAGVFGQTYRRYLDLLKAEANAREAQIEASLERVRAKAMAMHSSKDLAETLSVFYRELKSLSVVPIRCGVALMDQETQLAELTTMNTTEQGDSIEIAGTIKMAGHPVLDGVFENWLTQKEYHAVLRGNQIKEYYQVLKPQISYLDYPHDEVQFGYYFMFKEGDVYAWTEKELTEDELTIYRRFTTVISLTYKRYKDLQQAEAQAREAKIEAGLERVRARTMAMHSSEDVGAATATMFTELERLGIENFRGGITNIHPNRTQEVWSVNNLAEGKSVKAVGIFNMDAHPFWQQMYEEWVNKKDFVYTFLTGKEKENYIKILNATQGYLPQTIQEFPDVHFQVYAFNEGGVWTNSLKPHTEEEKQIMKRFASVFSLTFRRYQDLQKAEAQAREATIETALEKVRGKAMAMHNSNDLTATASLVFTELRKLGISPMRCGVGMLNKENRKALLYTAIASEEGDSLSQIGWVLLEVDPVLRSIYDHWSRGEDYFPVLKKEMLRSFYEHLKSGFVVPEEQTKYEHHGYFLPFSEGVFYGWSEKPFTGSEIKILKRFASVIDLTFRRYIELQKSETNAREAVKQAALDRVRAEIASMRTINDLDRITPLIWNELTILGIPFIRCGVFIMDDGQELIHTFLSTPDGKAIAAFHLPYDTPGNLRHVVANWKKSKKYIDRWDESEFKQFADILVKEGALVSSEQYLKTIPKGGFYLHFLPFLQGMLYVGNTTQLKQEEIELIQHVADAFSTAYARYEDFNKLEAAKQQVEKTLTDLKQTQQQLVQSEKMASLGEMTAGIAHEIQNPLNFVNNFSEVSKELLDEMKTELETGNTEDAKDIADNVIQNLEKINHHGKRADAIVKSMLQHSRSSSGKKEPADINGLADEYLRLAYHGLRAKDKSFNAKFETELDNSIGKINIISQDIGRVLVNLINNAFYAVGERKKQESNGYEPTVTVYTKKINDKIEIKVKDNGNGIPQKVLDKIFQPFFTTKPTGQGTGLGLSLAYDIITKGHGGELKVKTKEGEGTEFIIQIPMN